MSEKAQHSFFQLLLQLDHGMCYVLGQWDGRRSGDLPHLKKKNKKQRHEHILYPAGHQMGPDVMTGTSGHFVTARDI